MTKLALNILLVIRFQQSIVELKLIISIQTLSKLNRTNVPKPVYGRDSIYPYGRDVNGKRKHHRDTL